METREQIRISVRSLVEFVLRSGDIDNRVGGVDSREAMQAGSRLHRKIQKKMGVSYHAEVPLKLVVEEEDYQLVVEGRADGIIIEDEVTIDEIKGIYRNLEFLEEPIGVHLAQAKCYAYIYGIQHDLLQVNVQMTYGNLDTDERKYFTYTYSMQELQEWFSGVIREYKKWADFQYEWRKIRQESIRHLEFPYEYRPGQRDLVSGVYRTIARKKTLFIQAPTGVGKTIATLFPAVRAVGEKLGDKIFYLTAKTITANVAKEAFALLAQHGYRAKTVQITAKEKMCLCEKMECNPDGCPYAKGHYDRVNDAVYDLLHKDMAYTREVLLQQAEEYQVCPFEMCLDTTTWADNIICDYNYVFDPNVYLKRFFSDGIRGDYIFLVDEAHNLVERGREMYSAKLYKEDFLAVRKILKVLSPAVERELTKCNKLMLAYKRVCDTCRIYENIPDLIFALMRLGARMDEFMQKHPQFPGRDEVSDFYFALRNFLNIYERVDDHYVIYGQHEEDGRFAVKLFCVDPSYNLQECVDKANATIFFSATLLPIQYYKKLLTTKTDVYAVYAQTTFSQEQRLLLIGTDVSSKYTRRSKQEYRNFAEYIYRTAKSRTGNYIAFFPSYLFLDQVYEQFMDIMDGNMEVLRQESSMREAEREEFLLSFTQERDASMVAFCVLGGIFGEGIDLKEEQLIGAIIVGTGLPQISREREILKDYYDERGMSGFDYAYRFPGMNKVLQAAGRVIRTAADVGVIELLDERFLQSDYRALFPREWEQRSVCNLSNVERRLDEFWKQF
ncbi:MAG: ATP-dependent DNA helicase [Lachnospiraceae bacterium]|nr:ATP-dependent DNA helicase [Lachnospiraceae bacterium]